MAADRLNCLELSLTHLMNAILLIKGQVEPLLQKGSRIREVIFYLGVWTNQMNKQARLSSPRNSMGMRQPKTSVNSFAANIMNWNMFWKQFEILTHRKNS